jgi:alkaline phosphatase D
MENRVALCRRQVCGEEMIGVFFSLLTCTLRLSGAIMALLLITTGSTLRAFDLAAQPDKVIQRVAFGSCNNSTQPAPVWDAVAKVDPQVWLWLGDTVYADDPRPTGDTLAERTRVVLDRLPGLYARQRALPAYQSLMNRALIMGTWDDHDYGLNDMGADFPGRVEAQQHFFDFYGEPNESPRRTRPGVYSSIVLGPPGKRLQVVILDTRSFRSPLENGSFPREQRVEGRPGPYRPSSDETTTLLGPDQWAWLERTLQQPAEVRIIASSIQVIADDHRFEKWGNFPHERRRLLRLIHDQRIGGVILVSGDRHTGELSCLDPLREPEGDAIDPGYPLFDLTSSALNRSAPIIANPPAANAARRPVVFSHEINRHRIGSRFGYNHFGLIEIDWSATGGGEVTLSLRAETGDEVLRQRVAVAALQPDSGARPGGGN